MSTPAKLRGFLDSEAKALGFDACGVVRADAVEDGTERLTKFINAGFHGSMDWMAETLERRSHPNNLWPDAKSIIVLAMNYGPESDPMDILGHGDQGAISVYARNRDYHDIIKGKLKTLTSKLISRAQSLKLDCDAKVFVDTAPVLEKPLAQMAGLGWQGKHTNLVSREFGSWLFLGSIFTTLDLAEEEQETDHCGRCTNCLDICPTDAFPAPYQLNASKCISYLTIEHKGPIPAEFRKSIGNRIYGCDDCLAVCPWNKFASIASETKLAAPEDQQKPMLKEFLQLDDAGFRDRFSGSPVKRIGRNRFVRNCLIAAGNSNQPGLIPLIAKLQNDPDPIVCEAARWAQNELGDDKS